MQLHFPLNPTTGVEDQSQLPWTDGNPATATEGSYPPHAMCVETMDEVVNAISQGLLTPASSDLFQLTRAIRGGQLDFDATDTGTANAVLCQIGLPHTAVKAGLPFTFIKGPAGNTGVSPFVLTITDLQGNNAVSGQLLKAGGGNLAAGDIPANALVTVRADANGNFRLVSLLTISDVVALIQANTLTLLRANVTVYVRPDGSDANDGRVDSAARAFATPSGAFSAVGQLYILAGFKITIQLSTTYVPPAGTVTSYPGLVAGNTGISGSIVCQGDPANPQNYRFTPVSYGDGTLGCCISAVNGVTLRGITCDSSSLTSAQAGSIVRAAAGGTLILDTVTLKFSGSNTGVSAIGIDQGGTFAQAGPITYTLGTVGNVIQSSGNYIGTTASAGATQTISNATFTNFIAVTGSTASFQLTTFAGSGNTGTRYYVTNNGVMLPPPAGLSTIPGSAAGYVTPGGGFVPGDPGVPWSSATVGVTVSSGSLSPSGAVARYQRIGRIVFVQVTVTLGTYSGSGSVQVQLPVAPYSSIHLAGRETAVTGKGLTTQNANTSGLVSIIYADGTATAATGGVYELNGSYEAAA